LRTLQPPQHRNATGLGCSEFARHYYRNRGFFLFLQVLRWFTSLSSLTSAYVFSGVFPGFAREGFPIRRSPVITPVCGLPKLIAACHVLHRLSLPRHSPCALSSLTIELTPSSREPNRFGPDRSQPTYFRLESGLAHSHAQSPRLLKTLFLLEHLPKPPTYSESLRDNSRLNCLCSALYRVIHALILPACLAAAGTRDKSRMRFTQSISLSNIQAFSSCGKARPEAVMKPAGPIYLRLADLSPGRSHPQRMAATGKQRMSSGGAERDRTADPLLAKQVLSQLSYSPTFCGRNWVKDGGPG
jgi:hypothetical protein